MSPEEFAKAFGVSRETISRLQAYHDLLVKWQKAINIVSPRTLDDIWARHFADSAQLAERIPRNAKVADLGSGGGFPGLVLAIMRPDLEMHLVESDLRKSEFLKNVSRETKSVVRVHNDRAENALASIGPDIITARAFAPLVEILEMTQPIPGVPLLLLKGRMALEEVEEARKKFSFEYADFPSRTEEGAKILEISRRG
ncbi:MAG: 16S rRNA (guanine(527)-N(7))-methyltransferase RsmG [Alphaproteobacteria bacterium PRO2]|nr:16S rRNA (guanine(527)-N(7))-methyltransferase RsmG [Alphaproteobacteria bacterium PRO2]